MKLILPVCQGEHDYDNVSFAAVGISLDGTQRILRWRRVIDMLIGPDSLHKAEFWWGDVEAFGWVDQYDGLLTAIEGDVNLHGAIVLESGETMPETLAGIHGFVVVDKPLAIEPDAFARIECTTIHVLSGDVRWEFAPKHAPDYMVTNAVPLEAIDAIRNLLGDPAPFAPKPLPALLRQARIHGTDEDDNDYTVQSADYYLLEGDFSHGA